MTTPSLKRRILYPTPGWLVTLSLAVTGMLFLSERFQWFPFNTHKGWTVLIAVAGVGVVLLALPLWFVIALVLRRQFQFLSRTLLVLVVAVALPFSWLGVGTGKGDITDIDAPRKKRTGKGDITDIDAPRKKTMSDVLFSGPVISPRRRPIAAYHTSRKCPVVGGVLCIN